MRTFPRLLLLSLVLAACAQPAGPSDPPLGDRRESPDGVVQERRVGTIEHYRDPVRVEAPASVAVGETFEVRVTTYGGGCIAQGDTEVAVGDLRAVVTPYDWETVSMPRNFACTSELRFYTHTAALRFDRAGTATVAVRGRERPGDRVFTVERRITVR